MPGLETVVLSIQNEGDQKSRISEHFENCGYINSHFTMFIYSVFKNKGAHFLFNFCGFQNENIYQVESSALGCEKTCSSFNQNFDILSISYEAPLSPEMCVSKKFFVRQNWFLNTCCGHWK